MKAILKIARRNVAYHKSRTLFSLFCVILSVSIIAITLCLSASILNNVDFEGSEKNYSATKNLCATFSVAATIMSCFTICTAFSVSTQERIKEYGFLSSIGMSVLQRALMIIFESLIYGVAGVILGTASGCALASLFYGRISSLLLNVSGIDIGDISISASTVFGVLSAGLAAVILSSFLPILKMRKITILESIRPSSRINISLKDSVLSKLSGKAFGRIGVLAGQNYDNNKGKYRAISLALSGGTIFFLSVHSFFLFPIWDEIDQRNSWDGVGDIWYLLAHISAAFMAYFVFVFIFCSAGSIHRNIEQRKPEFAICKSMGMQNSELQKMITIECLFLTWDSILFGLVGSLIGVHIVYDFYIVVDSADFMFRYPVIEFLLFVCVDILVGLAISLYFRFKIGRINIVETMTCSRRP